MSCRAVNGPEYTASDHVDFAVRYNPEWFPGGGWKKLVSEQRETFLATVNLPHMWVREQMVGRRIRMVKNRRVLMSPYHKQAAGTAPPSFSSTLLEGNTDPEREHLIKMTATALYGGLWLIFHAFSLAAH